MITDAVRSTLLVDGSRLDAKYFTTPAVRIRSTVAASGTKTRRIDSYGTVSAPSRFKRTYAADGEDFISYLRPYDVFEFLPPEADRLSVARTEKLDEYRIKAGDLLQTCSGRNLGPLTVADEYLARFALSHDMIRVTIPNEDDRYYTLAFLQSPAGQHLLRADQNGSVIDHITVDQVSAVRVPTFPSIYAKVANLMRDATRLRETSRITLHDAVNSINEQFPGTPSQPTRAGWTVQSTSLGIRLDAAFHSDHVEDLRKQILDAGGTEIGSVSKILKPGGRYKTYYVTPPSGTPLLSGRQILQLDPVGAKNISSRSVATDSGYEVRTGWVCFQADGRAEESLGYPSVITADRDGWFASGHVGRVIPNTLEDTGWIWAALASDAVQQQIAALACGSVVDALYPDDLKSVVLPPRELVDSAAISAAWVNFAEASQKKAAALELMQRELVAIGI